MHFRNGHQKTATMKKRKVAEQKKIVLCKRRFGQLEWQTDSWKDKKGTGRNEEKERRKDNC